MIRTTFGVGKLLHEFFPDCFACFFSGPMWRRPGQESVLLASRRYDGSTSRKTKGSMADTLQRNLWRRALTPHRMTHRLHGGDNHCKFNGFTALGNTIRTRWSRSHHADVGMDFVFFIPPPPFCKGTLADFEPTLDTC